MQTWSVEIGDAEGNHITSILICAQTADEAWNLALDNIGIDEQILAIEMDFNPFDTIGTNNRRAEENDNKRPF